MKKKMALAVASLAAISAEVGAFQFTTGDDWDIRWDNQFKGNLVVRVAEQDDDVTSKGATQFLAADPDLSFEDGDIVSARLDLLSELDIIWRETFGFRASAAAWYDQAYADDMNQPDSIAAHWSNPSVDVGELTDEAEDLHFRGGELLDAFFFFNFDMGEAAASIRAGRHTIYWGQSLLLTGAVHSAGGSMNSVDAAKGFSVPGSEAKELFRPNNKISTVAQLTDNLTFSGYYSLEWEPYRLSVGTTYFSPADGLTQDTEVVHVAPGTGLTVNKDEHPKDGEWGANFAYYFEKSGLEMSAYYLNYHSKIQDGLIGVVGTPPTQINALQTSIGNAKWVYKEDVDLYGLSFAKQIGDVSYGMDITYRKEAPLRLSLAAALLQSGIDFAAVDESNYDDFFTTGDTYHVVVNALGLLNDNGIWEGGSYIVEATFSMLDDITSREDLVSKGVVNLSEGRITTHLAINFNPVWYQVFPGTDLTLKTSVGMGIDGNSPIGFGGDEEVGNGGVGVELNVDQKWTAELRYNFFFGPSSNGVAGLWKDRDNVSLTLKRTF